MSPTPLDDDEVARIDALPLLAALDDDTHRLVLSGFERVEHEFGEEIVREGEAPDGFYVLHEGTARVSASLGGSVEVALTVLQPGDTFGEVGVLTGEPSPATIRARGPVVVLRLDLGVALAMVRSHPEVRTAFEIEGRARVLGDFLAVHPAFSALPRTALARLVDELEEVHAPKGTTIIREGEPTGPMYVVQDGKLRARQGPAGAERDVRYLRSGAVFEELSLHRGTPRTATVEAVTDAVLLALDEAAFRRLVAEHPTFRARLDEQAAVDEARESLPLPLDFAEVLQPGTAAASLVEPLEPAAERPNASTVVAGASVEDLGAPPAAAPGSPGRRRRRRRFPLVRQIDEADCGVAALGMVCRFYGRDVASSFLRHHVGTGTEGTSLRGIQRGGERAGLAVRAVKASADRLDDLPLPAIIHWGGNHWVVLHEVRRDRVAIADPALGHRKVRRDEVAEHWSGYAALPSPTPALADAPLQRSDPRWIVRFARPYWRTFAAVFALSLFAAATAMLIPVLSQRIVDDVIVDRDHALLHQLTGGTLVLLFASMGAQLLRRRLLVHATLEIDGAAIDHVSGRMFDLPLGYFEGRRFADIERRLAGVSQIRALVVEQSLGALSSILTLVVAVVVMVAYSWPLALAFLAITPVYAGLMRYSAARLRPVWEGLEEASARYAGRQLDVIEGIATVKVMGAEPELRGGLRAEFRRLAGQMRDADLQVMKYEALVAGVSMMSSVLFLWLGALAVLRDDLTIGELLSFNAILLMTAGPVASLLGLWDQWTYAAVLLHRIQDVFDTPPEMAPDEQRRPVPSISGAVALRNVSFAYPQSPEARVVDDVSLEVPAGTTVALVGRSGSGKSTILKLVAGLLTPTAGTVTFDGVDVAELDLRQLRARLGVVLQQPYLFDTTLAGNIAFGDATPDLDEVRRAAAIADIAPFIEGLPLGYETKVGASGIRLSGGQEQRVAIARALYRSPTVLLLDEATSSLDTESERAVQQNLDRLLTGRTGFVIAHRLSTVRDADLIVVVEQGRIAETGTHEELLARGGIYAHLYAVQLPS